jgi:hypothetical protein
MFPLFFATTQFFSDQFPLRILFGYLSISLFFIFGYEFLKSAREFASRPVSIYICSAVVFIGIVGFLQFYFDKMLFMNFMTHMRTSSSRGVTALYSEPSFYGLSCLFLIMFCDILHKMRILAMKVRLFVLLLLVLQIVVFAQSSLAIVVTFAYLLLQGWVSSGFLLKTLVSLSGVTFLYAFTFFENSSSRLLYVAKNLMTNPLAEILRDQSMNQRATDIVISFMSIIRDFPDGFFGRDASQWPIFYASELNAYPFLMQSQIASAKIMSATGALLYETGIVGAACLFSLLYYVFKKGELVHISVLIGLLLAAANALPMAFPFIGLLMGALIYSINHPTLLPTTKRQFSRPTPEALGVASSFARNWKIASRSSQSSGK